MVKDKTFATIHQNIQSMLIKMYEAVNNLPRGNLSNFFVRNNHKYKLRSRLELTVPGTRLSLKVKILLVILDLQFGTQFQVN